MPITFIKKRKTQQYLIFIFAGLILLTIAVVWSGFLKEEKISPSESFKSPKIKINLKILENPIFEYLQSFEEITPFKGEVGRENPFIPY